MSLTIQEARNIQTIAAWVADLEHWEMDGGTGDEPAVAEALLRLAERAFRRLVDTGQGRGPTPAQLEEASSIQRMLGEQGDGS